MKTIKDGLAELGLADKVQFIAVQTVFEGHDENTAEKARESVARKPDLAHEFGAAPARETPESQHLREPVLRVHEAEAEERVRVARGRHVRHPAVVASHLDARFDSVDRDPAVLEWEGFDVPHRAAHLMQRPGPQRDHDHRDERDVAHAQASQPLDRSRHRAVHARLTSDAARNPGIDAALSTRCIPHSLKKKSRPSPAPW